MGVPHAGLGRNALFSLGILAVVAALAVGLPALDRAVPAERSVPVGVAYPVTDTVTVIPPAGARVDVSQTRPGRETGHVVFVVGQVRFAILVSPDQLTLDAAAQRLRTRLRDGLGARPLGSESLAPTGALTGRFSAGPDRGWYAVRVLGPATVVDATASGPPADLADLLPAIEAATASIVRAA
jgi:hypothetical protein